MKTDIRLSGFTLIELIIAIAITSLIGIAAHYMFNVVTSNHGHSKRVHEELVNLDTGLKIIKEDLLQLIPMRIKGEDFPAENIGLHIRPLSQAVETTFLELIRGNSRPSDHPSDMLGYIRVRYKLMGSDLIREEKAYPTTGQTVDWHSIRLLPNIDQIEIEVFDEKWDTLHSEYRDVVLPKAVRFNFLSSDWESAELIVLLSGESK
ncbi:MAG: type II secretion system protein GspJ [Neptuniibacter sp.]